MQGNERERERAEGQQNRILELDGQARGVCGCVSRGRSGVKGGEATCIKVSNEKLCF